MTGTKDSRDVPQQYSEAADWSSLAADELHRAKLRKRLVAALKELPAITVRRCYFATSRASRPGRRVPC